MMLDALRAQVAELQSSSASAGRQAEATLEPGQEPPTASAHAAKAPVHLSIRLSVAAPSDGVALLPDVDPSRESPRVPRSGERPLSSGTSASAEGRQKERWTEAELGAVRAELEELKAVYSQVLVQRDVEHERWRVSLIRIEQQRAKEAELEQRLRTLAHRSKVSSASHESVSLELLRTTEALEDLALASKHERERLVKLALESLRSVRSHLIATMGIVSDFKLESQPSSSDARPLGRSSASLPSIVTKGTANSAIRQAVLTHKLPPVPSELPNLFVGMIDEVRPPRKAAESAPVDLDAHRVAGTAFGPASRSRIDAVDETPSTKEVMAERARVAAPAAGPTKAQAAASAEASSAAAQTVAARAAARSRYASRDLLATCASPVRVGGAGGGLHGGWHALHK